MANVLREPNTLSSMHPGRALYLNLFKCINSDYERPHTGRLHLEGLVGRSGSVTLCWYDSSRNAGQISVFAYLWVYTNSESVFG